METSQTTTILRTIVSRTFDLDSATSYLKANPTAEPPTEPSAHFAHYLAKRIIKEERESLKGLTSYFLALTLAILPLLLLRWPRKTWTYRCLDVGIGLTCLALCWPHQPILALLALSLPVGYVVWAFLPDPPVSEDLPTHKAFHGFTQHCIPAWC